MNTNTFTPSDLKTILLSKRANIYYLEKCRAMQKDGRIVYLTETNKQKLYYNIPIGNTTVLLLGTGTSITQGAVRLLSSASVLVGFCGGGGTPLFSGTEIEWLTPQSEYRPTAYVQGWLSFWFDEPRRLKVAKEFQKKRCFYIEEVWNKDRELQDHCFYVDDEEVMTALDGYKKYIEKAKSVTELLVHEAMFTKALYKYAATIMDIRHFTRRHEGGDKANDYLNQGNYLAYGMAASCLWALGIPHGFAVMHGKTRRGALVFDVADLIKDAIVLPWAFISSQEPSEVFRERCLQKFTEHDAMTFMFDEVKKSSLQYSKAGDTV